MRTETNPGKIRLRRLTATALLLFTAGGTPRSAAASPSENAPVAITKYTGTLENGDQVGGQCIRLNTPNSEITIFKCNQQHPVKP